MKRLTYVGFPALLVVAFSAVSSTAASGSQVADDISETTWGPRSTYVEHSHLVPEFYYVLSGPVPYGVDEVGGVSGTRC